MNAWMSSARATATATVTTSSISPFTPALQARARTRPPVAALEESDPVGRPVGQERLADDPGSRYRPPEATVLRIGTVVAHHVVVPAGDGDRLREVARRIAVALNDVGVGLALAVAEDVSVADREMIAGNSDDTLDERLRRGLLPGHLASRRPVLPALVLALVGISAPVVVVLRRVEHHDVPD